MSVEQKVRCGWLPSNKQDYIAYHDEEWGRPLTDDGKLFELLCLETAQAGLGWYTILKKREGYRQAFFGFDIDICSNLTDDTLETILKEGHIVRNRLKVFSVRKNARVFKAIQQEFGSFRAYIWGFVDNKTVIYRPKVLSEIHITTPFSDALSKDLKKRGMTFVGSTTMHAYMQASGLINEHLADCFLANASHAFHDKKD